MTTKVPGEVFAAVATGRPELLQTLKRQLREGDKVIDKDMAIGIVLMIEDAIKMSQQDKEMMRQISGRMESCEQAAKGVLTSIRRLRMESQAAYTGSEVVTEEELKPAGRWESRDESNEQ
jgi:hypothetical protein